MNRSFNAIAIKCLLASLLVVVASQQIGPLAFTLDDTSLLGSQPQSLQDLFESEFAVLRIQGNQAKVAGVGFVIQQSPIRILTCYHVVSEGTEPNEGSVTYAIARRTEATNEIDVRKAIVSWLKIKRILFKPEYDMAVLEIDPQTNEGVAEKLLLKESKPLTLSFDSSQRSIGSPVTWLTTAAQGDLTLTPRLFTGSVVANYLADERYSYQSNSGKIAQQVIPGARMLEVDKLFIPGASGSPILNSHIMQVIGYVHGYRTFALNSNIEVIEDVEIREESAFRKEKLKYKPPLMTSVSLGIDLRTAEGYLAKEGYTAK